MTAIHPSNEANFLPFEPCAFAFTTLETDKNPRTWNLPFLQSLMLSAPTLYPTKLKKTIRKTESV